MFYFFPLLLVSALLIGFAMAWAHQIAGEADAANKRRAGTGPTVVPSYKLPIIMASGGLMLLVIGSALWPQVNVYAQEMAGRAELAGAEYSRQVKVAEAQAAKDSAALLAEAEILRAGGAAEANRIIQDGLGGPEGYLRYLSIQAMEKMSEGGNKLVYVPTEAGIPITEAGRGVN